MKAIFPCRGSVVVHKEDLLPLESYYNTQLIRSNMHEYMQTANSILQVGDFSYIPKSINLIINETQLNTIENIKMALHIDPHTNVNHNANNPAYTRWAANPFANTEEIEAKQEFHTDNEQNNSQPVVAQQGIANTVQATANQANAQAVNDWKTTPITDEDITSNPFFTTFKPL